MPKRMGCSGGLFVGLVLHAFCAPSAYACCANWEEFAADCRARGGVPSPNPARCDAPSSSEGTPRAPRIDAAAQRRAAQRAAEEARLREAYEANERGVELSNNEEWAKAVAAFEEAVQKNPDDRTMRKNLTYAQTGLTKVQGELRAQQQERAAGANLHRAIGDFAVGLEATPASSDKLSFDRGSPEKSSTLTFGGTTADVFGTQKADPGRAVDPLSAEADSTKKGLGFDNRGEMEGTWVVPGTPVPTDVRAIPDDALKVLGATDPDLLKLKAYEQQEGDARVAADAAKATYEAEKNRDPSSKKLTVLGDEMKVTQDKYEKIADAVDVQIVTVKKKVSFKKIQTGSAAAQPTATGEKK